MVHQESLGSLTAELGGAELKQCHKQHQISFGPWDRGKNRHIQTQRCGREANADDYVSVKKVLLV